MIINLFIYSFNFRFNIEFEKPFLGMLDKVYVCMYIIKVLLAAVACIFVTRVYILSNENYKVISRRESNLEASEQCRRFPSLSLVL